MKLVDIHAHLGMERFIKDLDDVMERAEKAGVVCVICSGVDSEANRQVLELSKKYKTVRPSFGLYPLDAIIEKFPDLEDDSPREIKAFNVDKELKWVEGNKDKCIAIGEVGLDFKVIPDDEKIRKEQIKVFEKVLELAKKIDKPVIIHSRSAEKECLDLLEKHEMKKVVLHCFSAKKSLIKRGIELGYYFSVPPVIRRLQHFQTLTEIVPLEQLLTETDAPYLSPVAGERNEPANVSVTIRKIARIKGLTEEEVAAEIWENFEVVFGIL